MTESGASTPLPDPLPPHRSDRIQHEPDSLAVYCPLCGLKVAGLLAALKEMRDAMAATMRVIARQDDHDRIIEEMSREFESIGIPDGFGVRSNQAIAKAEGK